MTPVDVQHRHWPAGGCVRGDSSKNIDPQRHKNATKANTLNSICAISGSWVQNKNVKKMLDSKKEFVGKKTKN